MTMKRSTAAHLARVQSPGIIGYRVRPRSKHRNGALDAHHNGKRKLYKEALRCLRIGQKPTFGDLVRMVPSQTVYAGDALAVYAALQSDNYLQADLALTSYLEM